MSNKLILVSKGVVGGYLSPCFVTKNYDLAFNFISRINEESTYNDSTFITPDHQVYKITFILPPVESDDHDISNYEENEKIDLEVLSLVIDETKVVIDRYKNIYYLTYEGSFRGTLEPLFITTNCNIASHYCSRVHGGLTKYVYRNYIVDSERFYTIKGVYNIDNFNIEVFIEHLVPIIDFEEREIEHLKEMYKKYEK